MLSYKFQTIILSLLFVAFSNGVLAQNGIPENVKKHFNQKFPAAKDVEWEKDGRFYEVEFNDHGSSKEVMISEEGGKVKIHERIEARTLPMKVIESVQSKYPKSRVTEAHKIMGEQFTHYHVEIEHQSNEIEALIDEQGNFIKIDVDDHDHNHNHNHDHDHHHDHNHNHQH